MKIGILGSGMVGQTIGSALIRAGHEIRIGTGHPEKADLVKWAQENRSAASISTFAQTAAFGEICFLCTNWAGTENALKLAGAAQFTDKLVLDVTNPLKNMAPDAQGRLSFHTAPGISGGLQVQKWLPHAKVVKALNSIGFMYMDHPYFEEGNPTMFIAGNDETAKKSAAHLLHQLGWEDVQDIGNIDMSDSLEELCRIWCAIGFRTGSWTHAFRLVRK
ncbi:MAG TPA: NAD(P)-binding domain-containing protein [Chitinophagaceae bacterium]|nr:NAD(P)-binding domain-containing protein [Chitinophagaceae bacterium]